MSAYSITCARAECTKSPSPNAECPQCGMVRYCSEKCKTKDQSHEDACKYLQHLMNEYKPAYDLENRPARLGRGTGIDWDRHPGGLPPIHECALMAPPERTLRPEGERSASVNAPAFADIPAYDILNLWKNEGVEFDGTFNILMMTFDLGSVIKTVVDLPKDSRAKLHFALNDKYDMYGLFRALFILILAKKHPNLLRAADAITHLWYSFFVPAWVMDDLENIVCPVIQGFHRDWCFDNDELQVSWPNDEAMKIITIRDNILYRLAEGMIAMIHIWRVDKGEARREMTAPGYQTNGVDFPDQDVFNSPPKWRPFKKLYNDHGVLCPHQASVIDGKGLSPELDEEYMNPNPLLFSRPKATKHRHDGKNPINGWYIGDILEFKQSPAPSNDLGGQFFYYLRKQLMKFMVEVKKRGGITFSFSQKDVDGVAAMHKDVKWDRIDSSWILDDSEWLHNPYHIGPGYHQKWPGTLSKLASLLNPNNPHATLIAHFREHPARVVKHLNTKHTDPEEQVEEVKDEWREVFDVLDTELEIMNKEFPVSSNDDPKKTPMSNSEAHRRAALLPSLTFPVKLEQVWQYNRAIMDIDQYVHDAGLITKEEHTILPENPISSIEDVDIGLMVWHAAHLRVVEWKLDSSPKETSATSCSPEASHQEGASAGISDEDSSFVPSATAYSMQPGMSEDIWAEAPPVKRRNSISALTGTSTKADKKPLAEVVDHAPPSESEEGSLMVPETSTQADEKLRPSAEINNQAATSDNEKSDPIVPGTLAQADKEESAKLVDQAPRSDIEQSSLMVPETSNQTDEKPPAEIVNQAATSDGEESSLMVPETSDPAREEQSAKIVDQAPPSDSEESSLMVPETSAQADERPRTSTSIINQAATSDSEESSLMIPEIASQVDDRPRTSTAVVNQAATSDSGESSLMVSETSIQADEKPPAEFVNQVAPSDSEESTKMTPKMPSLDACDSRVAQERTSGLSNEGSEHDNEDAGDAYDLEADTSQIEVTEDESFSYPPLEALAAIPEVSVIEVNGRLSLFDYNTALPPIYSGNEVTLQTTNPHSVFALPLDSPQLPELLAGIHKYGPLKKMENFRVRDYYVKVDYTKVLARPLYLEKVAMIITLDGTVTVPRDLPALPQILAGIDEFSGLPKFLESDIPDFDILRYGPGRFFTLVYSKICYLPTHVKEGILVATPYITMVLLPEWRIIARVIAGINKFAAVNPYFPPFSSDTSQAAITSPLENVKYPARAKAMYRLRRGIN